MVNRRCLGAVFSGFLVMFLLSGLWNIVIMGDFAREHGPTIMRDSPRMPFVILAYVILATLLTVVYHTSRLTGPVAAKGAKCGMLAGLLWMLPSSLMLHAVLEYALLPAVVDSAWAVIGDGHRRDHCGYRRGHGDGRDFSAGLTRAI